MNCDQIGKSIPLYFYGELPPEEEERVEDHLDSCEACRGALEQHRRLASAFDRREISTEPVLLDNCRANLMAAIRGGQALAPVSTERLVRAQPLSPTLGQRLSALWAAVWQLRQPIGAVALLAIGYFSAQWTGAGTRVAVEPVEPSIARVRSVQPDASGRVRIELDDVRKRVVSGRMNEGRIQQLLLAAARDDSNPGLRVASVDILKDHAGTAEIRAALLDAVKHDPNAGVRLKALEGLKTFAADQDVRKALPQILLKDQNPAVRIRAIDMLTSMRDDAMVGVLQNMVGKEDNGYVRWRCEKALKDMNASVGTF
jgi:hypothetical protein